MLRAWYMDDSTENDRKPHMRDADEFLDLETLKSITGVVYVKFDADNSDKDGLLDKIKKDGGYNYEDEIILSKAMDDYLKWMEKFYEEHMHADQEVRAYLDGSAFFDIRDNDDNWIRMAVGKGDMVILPAGIYHRFTLDENDYIIVRRYFVDKPVWDAYTRPDGDDLPSRLTYLKNLSKK